MTSINEKLGLRPRSRTRQTTHASGLLSSVACPRCEGQHVVEYVIKAPGAQVRAPWCLCGACGHLWER